MNSRIFRIVFLLTLAIGVMMISPRELFSQTSPRQTKIERITEENLKGLNSPAEKIQEEALKPFKRPGIATQTVVLAIASLSPFIIMILSSFLKLVVVLSLLRSALGVAQAPPNAVINGVALMLSIYIMYPTMLKMYEEASTVINNPQAPDELLSKESAEYFMAIANASSGPMREFLKNNTSVKHQALYYRMAYRVVPEEYRGDLQPDSFIILVPSFITSQLKDAFEIGVLIYIPFFVIDLVTSNILLAMGMMMLSPVTISMPLKLFLLVMMDGWTLLIEGLVNTFR